MAKMTVLELVQDILSDMSSDEVNSIDDTLEATQVANIVRTTYYEILNSREWPHLTGLMTLTPSGDNTIPTHITIPDSVIRMEWIKYNKRTDTDTTDKYDKVTFMDPEDFLNMLNARKSSESNVQTVVDPADANLKLFILNDRAPQYWTSFDDEYIVFDAFDSDVDTTTQASKIQAWGRTEPVFSLSDTYTPDLPAKAFPYLLSEAKSTAFNSLKQTANQKEEQKSRRQKVWLSRNSWRQDGGLKTPDYGRK